MRRGGSGLVDCQVEIVINHRLKKRGQGAG